MTIVRQFDLSDKNLYFTGAGICNIVRQFDTKTTREMDVLKEGQMVGENQAIFDAAPLFSVETKSYCAIGMVRYKCVKELL